ncbi:MAG TPA: pyruvate kinase [Bauldia sp.]|nr:pyruvate kinase [Bauldia sp.]
MRSDWPERLAAVEPDVAALCRKVSDEGRRQFTRWRPAIVRRRFAPSALNLAHYLELRQTDLRPLQRRLMALGLSSIGRSESRVMATLDAVLAAVHLAQGRTMAAPPPSERQFFRGEGLLRQNADEILGAPPPGRSGCIMVTLSGNAADDPAVLRDMVQRGANLVRINCAHDGPAAWARMIANARAASPKVRVLMDIAGPKVRTGKVVVGVRDRVTPGDEILLAETIDASLVDPPFQCAVSLPAILSRLKVGDRVLVDDGAATGVIARRQYHGIVVKVATTPPKGFKLKPEKGLVFPGVDLGLSPLTEKDRRDLDFAALNADLIGYSFVQSATHVALLQDELKQRRKDWQRLGLVAKIETSAAVRNLPQIMVAAASRQPLAVMIARGDLAIELGFERLAEMQEEILWLCEAAHVPAIWATEVLSGLVSSGLPSRGEMTDAAMAARAECVMLNKGANVGAGIETLDRLMRRMAGHQVKKTPTLRALTSWKLADAP